MPLEAPRVHRATRSIPVKVMRCYSDISCSVRSGWLPPASYREARVLRDCSDGSDPLMRVPEMVLTGGKEGGKRRGIEGGKKCEAEKGE